MKISRMLIPTVALLVSGPVLAGSAQQEQLTQCKAELAAIYGEDAGMRLKSIRSGKSLKMRIQVRPVDGDSVNVNCALDAQGQVLLSDGDGVALIQPEYDSSDKLTVVR